MNPIAVIKGLWEAWDVRAMIILSLLLQIILFVLGNRRKFTATPWVGIVLWLVYLSADSVATAALGKLSSTCLLESGPSNFLRGLWASLLLLHLGGPDTITAYAFEDNLLWKRHLLELVIQVTLAIYVIVLSWTRSWLSLLNIPMFLTGIIKYLERTWSLYSASSRNSRKTLPLSDCKSFDNYISENSESNKEAEKIMMAHQCFALLRPELKTYFSITGNITSIRTKIMVNFEDKLRITARSLNSLAGKSIGCTFDIVAIESGFMFDMLYTKSAIIYTKVGCILRLISFFCSSFVLVFLLHSFSLGIGNSNEQYWSRVDICITEILLAGAVALESYGLFLIISSDWFEILRIRYRKSRFLRGIFHWSLQKQHEKKRWSSCMGQFNLLSYCMSFGNGKGTKILQMIGIDEILHKHRQTSFREIPPCLKDEELFTTAQSIYSIMTFNDLSPRLTRGEKALEMHNCRDEVVKNTLLMDLGATIVIWHIATDICYHHHQRLGLTTGTNEKTDTCKTISDYMMYLLVMKSSMVYEDDNFWFDSNNQKLREILQRNNILLNDEAPIYQQLRDKISLDDTSNISTFEVLRNAIKVAEVLRQRSDTWDVMRSVWLEMMHYVAICCPHLSHLQELRQGGEILSHYWLVTMHFILLRPFPQPR